MGFDLIDPLIAYHRFVFIILTPDPTLNLTPILTTLIPTPVLFLALALALDLAIILILSVLNHLKSIVVVISYHPIVRKPPLPPRLDFNFIRVALDLQFQCVNFSTLEFLHAHFCPHDVNCH